MILSLLVGSLLVGRQIVDRAKIQRIIFEFDYYEKAFHQFYDTYRVVPGNLDYKTCIKHAEFQGEVCNPTKSVCSGLEKGNDTFTNQQFCAAFVPRLGISSKKILSTNGRSMWSGMFMLKKAGLISQEAYPFFSHSIIGDAARKLMFDILYNPSNMSYLPVGHNAISTSSKNVIINFIGVMNTYQLQYEKDRYYFNAVNGHNALAYQNAGITNSDASGTLRRDYIDHHFGAFTAKMASELDAKIDDGRPGSGRLLARKSTFENIATPQQISNICYEGNVDNLSSSIYQSSTDFRYGCNLLYIMEDVK